MSDTDEEPRDFSSLLHKSRHVRSKDNVPNESKDQIDALSASRDALFMLIGEERHASAKNICKGVLDQVTGLTHLTHARGTHLRVMGHSDRGQIVLYPEEAAWLLNMRLLDVSISDSGDRQADLSDYFDLMFCSVDGWISFEKYQVYAYLRRLGYIVQRAKPPRIVETSSILQKGRNIVHVLVNFLYSILYKLFGTRHIGHWSSPTSVLQIIPSSPQYKPFTSSCQKSHIHWDVYKPNPQWKKRDPGIPDFRIVVSSAKDAAPTLGTYQRIFGQLDQLPRPSQFPYVRIRNTASPEDALTFLMAVVDDTEGIGFLRITGDNVVDLTL
ncbi:hypothetical protein BX666DRAFT_1912717 [Dichotomocladium elegans]|nr:hypothetical protein BX666DRAFT_1912717 [Dichotomocladium elegans]